MGVEGPALEHYSVRGLVREGPERWEAAGTAGSC